MFTMVTYMTPMLGMGACYVQIGRNLWGGEVIGKFELHSYVCTFRFCCENSLQSNFGQKIIKIKC